jgi:hypothetical protein
MKVQHVATGNKLKLSRTCLKTSSLTFPKSTQNLLDEEITHDEVETAINEAQ